MTQSTASPPIVSFRSGLMEVSVWRNEAEGKEGKPEQTFSIKVEKRYKDASGNFRPASHFFLNELPRLRVLLDRAYEFIVMKEFEAEAPAA